MIVQSDFTLPVSMESAFSLLVDAEAVAAALTDVRPAAPGAMDGEMEVHVGGVVVTVAGRVSPGESDREAGALSFQLDGAEVGGHGTLAVRGAIRLRQAQRSTAVAVELDVEVSGRIAQQGVDAVEAAARSVLAGLADGLGRSARRRTSGRHRSRPRAATAAHPASVERSVAVDGDGMVIYPWMTNSATATAAGTAAAGAAAAPPAAASAGDAPDRLSPPAADGHPGGQRVLGRVTVVTDGPLAAKGIPIGDGAPARIRALHHQRPWLLPLIVASIVIAVLAHQRRSRRGGREGSSPRATAG